MVAPSYVVPSAASALVELGPDSLTEIMSPAPAAKLPGAVITPVVGSTVMAGLPSWAMKASLNCEPTNSGNSSE